MILVFYEIKKVLCKKVFIIILALCFALNIGIFCYMQKSGDYSQFVFSDFSSVAEEYTDVTLDEAEAMIENENKAYEILGVMEEASYAESTEQMDELLNILSEYKESLPSAYESAENMFNGTDYDENRESYIFELSSQVDYINSYPTFIKEMKNRADEQSAVSIFSNRDDFSYKNLYKTAEDYEHLSEVRLSLGNDIPVTAASDYTITDCFLIAVVLLACVYLFNQERELGLYNLVRSQKHGRLAAIAAKLAALFIVTAVIAVIFTASNYAVSSYLYGTTDFGRTIQSISDFRNCTLNISVGGFCLLTVLWKALSMIAVSSIFALLFIAFSNPSVMYIAGIGLTAVEYILKNLISSDTAFSYFKYINLFYMLDGKSFWGSYLNLSIFSNPVTVCIVDIIVFSAALAACVTATLLLFTFKAQNKQVFFASKFFERLRCKTTGTKGSVSIIGGEAYKYFILNKTAVIFAAVLAFAVFSSLAQQHYPYEVKFDVAYKEYMEFFEGEITPEKEEYLSKEQEYFDKLNARLAEIAEDSSLSENAKNVAENTISSILETKGEAFSRIYEQYERLLELKDSSIDAKFIDENLYPDFVFNSSEEWSRLALSILLLITTIPFLITVDYKGEMINLIRSTKKRKAEIDFLQVFFRSLFTVCYIHINLRAVSDKLYKYILNRQPGHTDCMYGYISGHRR
ncbi:MAG: hypothetical protein LUF33_04050 [Clostridiales bacterium]|nr:hypothetical protein [Clostridiales bacterium]